MNIRNEYVRGDAHLNGRSSAETTRGLIRSNLTYSRLRWGALPKITLQALKELTAEHCLSVRSGDLLLLEGRWYVTHTGLLRLARRSHCAGISIEAVPELSDAAFGRWAFKATVYRSPKCKGFVGYGDADKSNVSALVRGSEMRVAETRAVNRALRKAYGIGTCSVEELGSFSGPLPPAAGQKKSVREAELPNTNGHHPLRDRLCLLIRQHRLDPALVKAYAADYCDVSELRQAERKQVATFITHLAEYAQSDREGLLCQLNSYAPKSVCPAPAIPTGRTSGPEQEKEAGAA
jgi:hypothetical protein